MKSRIVLASLLLLSFFAYGSTVINVGTIVATPSGNIDSRYADGDDSNPLTWATVPNFTNKIEGNAFSVDVCSTYLTEPGTPDATITNVGAAFPTGWSLTGVENCTLDYNATGTGLAVVTLRATRSSDTADTNSFTVESVADEPPGGTDDTTSPTQIVGVTVTDDANPVISFYPPADVRVSGEDVSGLSTFTVTRNIIGLTPTAFTGTDFVPNYTHTDVGTVNPAGTDTQAVDDWTITGGGGHPNTATDFSFLYAPITGDFICTVRIDSTTGGVQTARGAGLVAREDLTAGSRHFNNFLFVNSNNVRTYTRAVTDGAVVQNGLVAFDSADGWLALTRVGDVLTAYAGDGINDLGQVWQETIGLNPTLDVGLAVQSNENGVAISAEYQNLACNTLPLQSFTDTGGSSGDSYTITAVDGESNVSTASTAVVAPTPPGQSSETADYVDQSDGVTLTQGAQGIAADAVSATNFACGTTYTVTAGTEGDNVALNDTCTVNNPVIIKCAASLACVATGTWTFTGAHQIVRGFDFNGGIINARGTRNKILANRFRSLGAGNHIQLSAETSAAEGTEIAYNTFTTPDAGCSGGGNFRQAIKMNTGGSAREDSVQKNVWIHHNHSPDWDNGSECNQGDFMEFGESGQYTWAPTIRAGIYIEDNLIEGHNGGPAAAVMDIKFGGNVIRGNSVLTSTGGSRLQSRQGQANIFEGNWVTAPSSIIANSRDQIFACNVAETRAQAGTYGPDTLGNGYPQAADIIVSGNNGRIFVGHQWGAFMDQPALRTVVRAHQGGVTIVLSQNEDIDVGGAAVYQCTLPVAPLGAGDVGPGAIDDASAGYKSGREL